MGHSAIVGVNVLAQILILPMGLGTVVVVIVVFLVEDGGALRDLGRRTRGGTFRLDIKPKMQRHGGEIDRLHGRRLSARTDQIHQCCIPDLPIATSRSISFIQISNE